MSDYDWPREPKRAADHDALCHAATLDYHDPECCDCDLIAKVRADMDWHQKVNAESAVALMQWRDELHAKVEALPRSGIEIPYAKGVEHEYEMVRRADVLRLIDGGSDD